MNLKNILIRDTQNNSYSVDLTKNCELEKISDEEISTFFDFQISEYFKGINFEINLSNLVASSIEEQVVLSFAKSLQDEWNESKSNIDVLKIEFEKFKKMTKQA